MTRRPRTWRAVASRLDPAALRPVVVARCYRATQEGLRRFVDEHTAAGCEVRVWQVLTLPGVDDAGTAALPPPVPSPP